MKANEGEQARGGADPVGDLAGKIAETLMPWWRKLLESLPFVAFFAVLFFTMYYLFGVADALLGIAFLFFSRTIVEEPGLSFANYIRRVSWFFIMAMCATFAGLHPVAMVLGSAVYLFAIVVIHSDDYLPRNFYWLGMGYLLLLIYPVGPEGIAARAAASLLSIALTTLFVFGMRMLYRKTGKIDELGRDRDFVRRAFDDVGNQLLTLSQWGETAEAGTAEGDVHPKHTFSVTQEYARMEYPTVFRQGGLLSGRQCYTFALLLCCEQLSHMAKATLRNIEKVQIAERRYFEDLAGVFLDYGRGHILTVGQMVTRLQQFLEANRLDLACHEEAWRGILEAMLRTLQDTGTSRSETTPFTKSIRYRIRYLRENVSLRNTQTRFALQMAVIVGLFGMAADVLLTQYTDAMFAIWIPITAFAVLNTYNDETFKATRNNAVGTLVGIAVFALFVHFIPADLRMPLVVPLSYLIILINFNQTVCVMAGTQMALIALYPYATLSAAVISRLVLVIVAVSLVMMLVFVIMRTRRSATIHARIAELERIDGRLAYLIHHAVHSGQVKWWRSVQLLYYLHMDSWLLESVAQVLGRATLTGKVKRDARLDALRRDVDRVLALNYNFAMDAEHAVMLLDPRRMEGELDILHGQRPDTTARIRHIDATAERLDEKIEALEDVIDVEDDEQGAPMLRDDQ